jgi:hypothetical protein
MTPTMMLLQMQHTYWAAVANHYTKRGEGFDHLVDDALNRCNTIQIEFEELITKENTCQN